MKIQDLPVSMLGGEVPEGTDAYPVIFMEAGNFMTWRPMEVRTPKGWFEGIGLMLCKYNRQTGFSVPVGLQLDKRTLERWEGFHWEGHALAPTFNGPCFRRMKSFVCAVEGLAARLVNAFSVEEAREELERELMEINDPHGEILSIIEVA